MNNLLQELRSATSALHRELDEIVPDPVSDPAAYRDYLSRFHRGVATSWPMLGWEKLVEMGLPEAPRRKRRYHSLEDDLDRLGIPHVKLRDSVGAEAAVATGCLYVLEGSIHGGRILLEKLSARADMPSDSLAFLGGFGDENSRMWASFTGWLTSLEAAPEFIAEARQGAMRTFRHFINSFGQN